MWAPQEDPDSWNTLLIEGEVVPGIIEFPDFSVGRKLDEKGTPGSDLFRLTDKGGTLADIRFVHQLWTPEQLEGYRKIYDKYIDPRRKPNKRNVVTVVHPILYAAGIRRVYFYDATPIKPKHDGGGNGAYITVNKAKEFTEKTNFGAKGSKVVKPKGFTISQGGLFNKQSLKPNQDNDNTINGSSIIPGQSTSRRTFSPRSPSEINKAASQGNKDAAFVKQTADKHLPRRVWR